MYPLDGHPALAHVIRRVSRAEAVDKTIVATSTTSPDDVIAEYAPTFGATVVRGSESNVQQRYMEAVDKYSLEIVVRVTGDCPLILPEFVDSCINHIRDNGFDYVSAGIEKTFPRGLTCEAFTSDSFRRVVNKSTQSRHKEHVTPYYREYPEEFDLYNVKSADIFDEEWLQERTDIRLTLDEPADYRLLETVYREVAYEDVMDIRDVVRHIDRNDLGRLNGHVEQKVIDNSE